MPINKTSARGILREEHGLTILAIVGDSRRGQVYRTSHLSALVDHPQFWDDDTIDHATTPLVTIELSQDLNWWWLETPEFSKEFITISEALEYLAARVEVNV